jgi:hypothetical protein
MALLKREIYRQLKGPEVTHTDRCTLVFDTDAKNLYVDREVTRLDTSVDGTIKIQTATMDIADYLKLGGQTAGHRELWRLLRTLFKDTDRRVDRLAAVFGQPFGPLKQHPFSLCFCTFLEFGLDLFDQACFQRLNLER